MSVDISIIITSYNVEHYIERAIHSALDQQGVSLEVILVDDCSTDNSFAIASSIVDDRLTCIRLAQNGGPSVARNAAMARASAPWLAVLDGDDAYKPDRLARCLARARVLKADVVVDNLTLHREADGIRLPMFTKRQFLQHSTLDLASFIRGNRSFLGGYTLGYLKPIFSADFLREHHLAYDPDIRIGEDYMLLAEVLACGAVCAIEPTAGYLYTVRTSSISHRIAPEDLIRIAACDQKFLSRHTLSPTAKSAQKQRESSMREAYAFTRLVQGLKKGDLKEILSAFTSCPSSVRYLSEALWVRIKRYTLIGQGR